MIGLLGVILPGRRQLQKSSKSGFRIVGLSFEVLSTLPHDTGSLLRQKCTEAHKPAMTRNIHAVTAKCGSFSWLQ